MSDNLLVIIILCVIVSGIGVTIYLFGRVDRTSIEDKMKAFDLRLNSLDVQAFLFTNPKGQAYLRTTGDQIGIGAGGFGGYFYLPVIYEVANFSFRYVLFSIMNFYSGMTVVFGGIIRKIPSTNYLDFIVERSQSRSRVGSNQVKNRTQPPFFQKLFFLILGIPPYVNLRAKIKPSTLSFTWNGDQSLVSRLRTNCQLNQSLENALEKSANLRTLFVFYKPDYDWYIIRTRYFLPNIEDLQVLNTLGNLLNSNHC